MILVWLCHCIHQLNVIPADTQQWSYSDESDLPSCFLIFCCDFRATVVWLPATNEISNVQKPTSIMALVSEKTTDFNETWTVLSIYSVGVHLINFTHLIFLYQRWKIQYIYCLYPFLWFCAIDALMASVQLWCLIRRWRWRRVAPSCLLSEDQREIRSKDKDKMCSPVTFISTDRQDSCGFFFNG